jgi:predicted dehydrogenase
MTTPTARRNPPVNRRQFVGGAAAAAVGAPMVITGAAFGGGVSAPSNRIGLGFIGLGWKGFEGCWGSLLQSFIREPGTQVLAVCDVDRRYRQRAKVYADQFYGNQDCAVDHDFRELVRRPGIDAVVIATPDHWHAVMTIRACREGKDVYCEKPLSLTVREARAMVTAARRYDRVVQTGSQSRSNPNLRAACELIRQGRLGKIREVYANCGGPSVPCDLPAQPVPEYLDWDRWLGPAPWRPYHEGIHPMGFRNWQDYSGGGMTDWGAHHFDLAQWALGMDASGPVEVLPPGGKDRRLLTFRYADGTEVYHGAYGQHDGVTFLGTEGKAMLSGISGSVSFDPPALAPRTQRSVVAGDLFGNRGHYADFLECVRTRRTPAADVETGCRTVTVCHIGNIAYALRRPLKWDAARETFGDDAEANRLLERAHREPWNI